MDGELSIALTKVVLLPKPSQVSSPPCGNFVHYSGSRCTSISLTCLLHSTTFSIILCCRASCIYPIVADRSVQTLRLADSFMRLTVSCRASKNDKNRYTYSMPIVCSSVAGTMSDTVPPSMLSSMLEEKDWLIQ